MHAWLFVLASSEAKEANPSQKQENDQYIPTQLGIIRVLVEGGLGAKTVKKPKVVILFLNKFDLYSSLPPDDHASIEIKKKYEEIFSKHIRHVKDAGQRAKVPVEVIVGSALENWNCNRIIDKIGESLFSK